MVYGLTAGNALIRFDSANPTAITTTAVTGLGANQTLVGIDFRPRTGQLIGSTVMTGSTTTSVVTTYSINPTTGAATLIGATAATVTGAGQVPTAYDFNPTVDRIRYANTNDINLRLSPVNGALAATDTNLTPMTVDVIEAAYDRNFDRQALPAPPAMATNGVIPTTLFVIDRASGQLATLGGINGTPSPNAGAIINVGALGVMLSATNGAGFDITIDPTVSAALNNNGRGRALAALTSTDNITRLYDVNLTTGAATLIGVVGNGTLPLIGLTIVPASAVTVGSGPGVNGDSRLLDANNNGNIRQATVPFVGFNGGIRTASGDVNGDGTADLIVSAVTAQGHVKAFSGVDGSLLASFFAFQGFLGTVNIGAGDVNADGFDDILVVANGVSGHTKAFSGKDGSLLASFLAYPGFTGNTTVSGADFDLNGTAEIVTVAAVNGHVKVSNANGTLFTSASQPAFVSSFLAVNGFIGDVSVTAGDVSRDNVADIVLSTGAGTRGNVTVISGVNNSQLSAFSVLGPGAIGGASVALADVNRDGFLDIAATPGAGVPANVFLFDFVTGQLPSFPAFAGYLGGATVGGSRG